MSYEVNILADSVSPQHKRLTTFFLKYPKFIHGEAKTHRKARIGDAAYEMLEEVGFMDDPALSRNASSSRAIPVRRMINDILADPVMPVFWGKHQSGMAADEEVDAPTKERLMRLWMDGLHDAVATAEIMGDLGAHKQLINRLLEPWMHIRVVASATDWANFFHLRCHPAAQPEMRHLANMMRDAMAASTPKPLMPGQWHLPYVSDEVQAILKPEECRKISAARCGRTSYLTHDGRHPSVDEDIALYARLVGGDTVHASPTEHQGTPDTYSGRTEDGETIFWSNPKQHGNFTGFIQARHLIPNESVAG